MSMFGDFGMIGNPGYGPPPSYPDAISIFGDYGGFDPTFSSYFPTSRPTQMAYGNTTPFPQAVPSFSGWNTNQAASSAFQYPRSQQPNSPTSTEYGHQQTPSGYFTGEGHFPNTGFGSGNPYTTLSQPTFSFGHGLTANYGNPYGADTTQASGITGMNCIHHFMDPSRPTAFDPFIFDTLEGLANPDEEPSEEAVAAMINASDAISDFRTVVASALQAPYTGICLTYIDTPSSDASQWMKLMHGVTSTAKWLWDGRGPEMKTSYHTMGQKSPSTSADTASSWVDANLGAVQRNMDLAFSQKSDRGYSDWTAESWHGTAQKRVGSVLHGTGIQWVHASNREEAESFVKHLKTCQFGRQLLSQRPQSIFPWT